MGLLRNFEEAHAFYGGDFFVPYICIGCHYLSFASRYALRKKFSRMQVRHDPTCFWISNVLYRKRAKGHNPSTHEVYKRMSNGG